MAKKKATTTSIDLDGSSDSIPETFEDGGKIYKANPTFEEFLTEAGVAKTRIKTVTNSLKKASVTHVSMLLYLSRYDLEQIDGIADGNAMAISNHAIRVKHRGKPVKNMEEVCHLTKDYLYLTTGSPSLDKMLKFSNGQMGFRSKALVELYGAPASGKTQICLTAAIMTMRPREKGGWGRGIAYIDSEGAFDVHRFKSMARYWGVDPEFIEDHLLYARVDSFDEVELAIDRVSNEITDKKIGTIIVDSIMDPLRSSYPVGGSELRNLQPRQKHLKRVLDKMKTVSQIHNMLVMYTNHVRANIGDKSEPNEGAQGGVVLGHASDIRILLNNTTKVQREKFFPKKEYDKLKQVGIDIRRATVVDSGFIAANVSQFLIGFMGIGEPSHYKELMDQASMVKEKGYICVDSNGNELDPLEGDTFISPEEQFRLTMQQLYGPA